MNQPKRIFSFLSIMLIVLCGASTFFAQADPNLRPEQSYEAVLQVVLGVNDASVKTDIPQNLSTISKQLRDNYSFPSYRLANTFIGRVTNNGTLEYRSVSDIFGQPSDQEIPVFLEWTLGRLQSLPGTGGQPVMNAQPFRFGARVPVRTGPRTAEARANEVINYEQVGLTVNRVSVPENRPTLIGTLALPKTTGTMFLVLTVRPTGN
jgi:hypothetical protein